MKKLGGVFVAGCLAAALVQAPAAASAGDRLSRQQAAKLCKAVFAEDRCSALAAEWRQVLASRDRAAAEKFVDSVLEDAGRKAWPGEEECRWVFSESVCVNLFGIITIALWPLTDTEGFIYVWRDYSLQYVDAVYAVLDGGYSSVKAAIRCAVDPACTPWPV